MIRGDSDERFSRFLAWIAALLALGVLGLGCYAVFHSTNGSGTATLLVIGPLALFVILFRDRIRSMEFGGARVQLALRVKSSLKRAFELRLAGDYEQAQAEIEDAFDQFVAQEPRRVRKAYAESKEYRNKVLKELGEYAERNFEGKVLRTAATVSFLPLIDAVMKVNGHRVLQALQANGKSWCPELVQNCKDSESQSRLEFCKLVNERPMHAKSMVWQPSSGSKELENAFLNAIMTICDPVQCGFPGVTGRRPSLNQDTLEPGHALPTGR